MDSQAHAATCPQRVRVARIVDRPERCPMCGRDVTGLTGKRVLCGHHDDDPVQKLIPAAAKMREPITVRAKR